MTDIPELPSDYFGKIHGVDPSWTHGSYTRLADTYGPIFAYRTPGDHVVVINSHELLNEVCDEKRFHKVPFGGLAQLRNGLGDGLFTAFAEEENWYIAHRILTPKFGPLAIQGMFDEMLDIASQMVGKWARQGPEVAIDPVDDFTRLTLDSIALCAMGTRFNSFYRDHTHPFVDAMVYFLLEGGRRAFRPAFMQNYVYRGSEKRFWESIDVIKSTALEAIRERRKHPVEKNDLLNAMLLGKDPVTGQGMTEESIVQNALTCLIAGHETTSGMLSFLFINLLKSPRALKAAQDEVDKVIGTGPITVDHLNKLPYITACMRETLRLWPTAPGVRLKPVSTKDEDFPMYIGKNRYKIQKGDGLHTNNIKNHRDQAVYGEDAEQFKPERMLDDAFQKLPPNSWKPFGNGMRACIGRAFAWQEGQIAIAMILQNFDLRASDPSYVMKYRQTLTIKPVGFSFHATLRNRLDPIDLERRLWGGKGPHKHDVKDKKVNEASEIEKNPIQIFYGSNAGTCESLAQSLASTAAGHGYAPKVISLDEASGKVPKDQPIAIITPSYEGEPPDNAVHFFEWLRSLRGNELEGVKYAVFGCGNHDWATTFHRIPNLVDDLFAHKGATRIAEKGLSDVADNHVFDDFDRWQEDSLWPGINSAFGHQTDTAAQSHGLDVEFHDSTRVYDLRQDVSEAIVKSTKLLTASGESEKRHLELQLPSSMTYTAGDYLAVLPMNPSTLVKSIMARFGLAWDSTLEIREGQHTALPQGRALTVFNLLSSYVELNQPVTHKQLATLAACTADESTQQAILSLTLEEISHKRISIFDLLAKHLQLHLPFPTYLNLLPPLRIRQYSISSSPLQSPHTCTLTFSVLSSPSLSNPSHQYLGTASTYLSELSPGDKIYVTVRPSHQAFHPPLDVENIPIIMICAGTGVAPFRAFVQQRAEQISAGRTVAPALLFIGCRHLETDALYLDEFNEWEEKRAVQVKRATSKSPEESEGCKYVQHLLWKERESVRSLWAEGAKMYVCGSGKMAEEVDGVLVRIWVEKTGKSEEEAREWLRGIRNERFASDVFD